MCMQARHLVASEVEQLTETRSGLVAQLQTLTTAVRL